MRTVTFFISDTGMTPTEPQCAGVQGEHNATTVVFTLPSSWITADYAVRAEFVDGTGAFDTTAFLERTDSTVSVPLPVGWTAAGGLAEIRLAAALLNAAGMPEETVAYSPVGYLYFDSRAGEPAVWRSFENRGLSALIADSHTAAALAEKAAAQVMAQLESGAFNGKDGEKGEKGDAGEAGADGCGLLPVTQTAVSATADGNHIYEVYVGTDYTALPPAWMLAVYLTYGMTTADTLRIYGNGLLFESTAANYPEKTAAVGNNLFTFDGATLRRVSGAKGENGTDGVGIAAIEQTVISAEDGGENVFTVTLTNGQTATFTVRNGSKGATGADGTGSDVTVSDAFDPDSGDAMSGKAVNEAMGVAFNNLAPQLLPAVTADDNGKLLQVVDGAWAAVTIIDGNEVAY